MNESTNGLDTMAAPAAPNVNDYLNSREYLRDFYIYKQKTHKGVRAYNYAHFSAAADIKSPSYLKLIIEGKRNLSKDMALKFAKAMKISKSDTKEFCVLVEYTQESNPLKRNEFLQELESLRVDKRIKSGEIKKDTFERVPNWVAWVLYALVDQKGVDFSIDSLKEVLRHKVKPDTIEKSLHALIEQGQLKKQEDGSITKGEPITDSGAEEIPVELIRKIQSELNYRGMESLFEDSAKEREFGALTVSLTKEEFERYRFELRQLRKKIHKEVSVAREQEKGDRVYQLNLQLFPITDEA